jgi:hypothetical protein
MVLSDIFDAIQRRTGLPSCTSFDDRTTSSFFVGQFMLAKPDGL